MTQEKSARILFDGKSIPFILEALGLKIFGDFKQIVYPDNSPCLYKDETYVTTENFAGIMKGENGEMIFIKDDIFSIMELAKGMVKK